MGTKVHFPGYHPVGDLNDDSNIGTWPVYYGESLSNGQFHDRKTPRTIADAYFGYHTEAVKQKMLEQEATFHTQLRELHRVYRVQRELMDDFKMNELQKQSMALDTSMSSCSASQRLDVPPWLTSEMFPFSSSSSAKTAVLGQKDFLSAPIFSSGISSQNGLGSPNGKSSSKDSEVEILECRPSKVKRKLDLELRADEYIDVEEPKPPGVLLARSKKINGWVEARQNRFENGLADLNGQIRIEGMKSSSLNFNGFDSNFRSKPQVQTHPGDYMQNSYSGSDDSRSRNLAVGQNENRRGWSHTLNAARSNGHTAAFPQNSLSDKIDFFNKDQGASYRKEESEGGPEHSGICFFSGISNPPHSDRSFLTYKASWNFAASSNCAWPLNEGWHINSGIGIDPAYQNESGPGRCATLGIYAASGGKTYLNGSVNLMGLTNVNASSAKGIDLNIAYGGDSHEYVDRPNLNRAAELPWLKASTGLNNGDDQSFGSSSRIMGVPLFEETHLFKGASSLSKSEEMDKYGTVRGFDMNLPWEDEKNSEMPLFSRRNHIDLNLCTGDDEDSAVNRGFGLKAFGDITHKDISKVNQQNPDDGLAKVAAEAIVDISSSGKISPLTAAAADALQWFVDIISLFSDDAEKVDQSSSYGMEETDSADYFEYMTLNLQEVAKEEYLPDYPNPLLPNASSTSVGPYTGRTRKGQARRGRPRRDFQGDILPGLTSLARHEVTEDLQALGGGLMRTAGQSWQSSQTRRSVNRRGRPRMTPVQPPYLTSPPKKKRTRTEWEKMTRRPRRQRSAPHIA